MHPVRGMKMAEFPVPTRYRSAILALAKLDSGIVSAVASALDARAGSASADSITEAIESVGELPGTDAGALSEALLALSLQRIFRQWDVNQLADSVSRSGDLEIQDDARPRLAEALTRLLSRSTLTVAAKAADLMTEHEHRFFQSRIVTDIRPVFEDNIDAAPTGALLTGSIRIDYFARREFRTMYFGIDEENLKELRTSVDRALNKLSTLESFLESANMRHLNLGGGDDDVDRSH